MAAFFFTLLFLSLPSLLSIPAAQAAQPSPDYPAPVLGDFDPATLDGIDPADYPVVPSLTAYGRTLFERGQARETPRDARMFSKVGDSMTASASFLTPFAGTTYDLGDYRQLERVIAFFAVDTAVGDTAIEATPEATVQADGQANAQNAFNRTNYATALGFSTASALDSTWAVAEVCEPGETPLACEFRLSNSAFALIMFGTNDVLAFDASLYDYFLRQVVLETAAADIVPILYTMPIRPEAPELSATFNQIILKVADDYDLPVINLVVALDSLPQGGVDPDDTLHLTAPEPPLTVATFTNAGLEAGYTVRNLVTLQTLDQLLDELGLYKTGETTVP